MPVGLGGRVSLSSGLGARGQGRVLGEEHSLIGHEER